MIEHDCGDICLYCMVTTLYHQINCLKDTRYELSKLNLKLIKEKEEMDTKIKKLEAKERSLLKGTKSLLKADIKQDKKMKKCDMKMKKKK